MSAAIATALRRIILLDIPAEALREMISIVADLVGASEVVERAVASTPPTAVPEQTASSTARVRRHRAKSKALAGQIEMFRASIAVDNTRNAETPVSNVSETVSPFHETLQRKGSPPLPKESLAEADASARAPPSKSLISPEAFALADRIRDLMRIDPDDTRAVGMAYKAQDWLTKGWKDETVLQAVEIVMARLKGIPPRRLTYFEPAIAEVHANIGRPLPTARPSPFHSNVQVLHGTEQSSDWRARRDARYAAHARLKAGIAEARAADEGG